MINFIQLLNEFQAVLGYNDDQMSAYLGVGKTVYREGRNGTEEPPTFAAAIILTQLDLIRVRDGLVVSDVVSMMLTKRAREKYQAARNRHTFSRDELEMLAPLGDKYRTVFIEQGHRRATLQS